LGFTLWAVLVGVALSQKNSFLSSASPGVYVYRSQQLPGIIKLFDLNKAIHQTNVFHELFEGERLLRWIIIYENGAGEGSRVLRESNDLNKHS